jgi:hypothetical protein
MKSDKNLQFITNRILDTRVALFHCHTNALLKIPTCVVNTFKVDDGGCVWFTMSRPQQLVSQFDKEFPVGLNYFKKGNNYSMNIFGKARIVNDPEELMVLDMSTEEINDALNKKLLVCVKILKVDYFDHDQERKNNLLQKVKTFIYGILDWAEPDGKSFEFSPTPGIHHYGF